MLKNSEVLQKEWVHFKFIVLKFVPITSSEQNS